MVDSALIVGAGPTGLTLGCELLRRNIPVRLVEQLAAPTDQSRALALQSRTLEIFEKMGLLEEFVKQGLILRHANFYYNRKRIGGVDFSHLRAPHPFILILPQSQTEKILADHFEKLGGRIERNVSLQDVDAKGASLLHSDGREERISPTWTFGCDGAHSAVRHSLNLPFEGARFPENFALADVEVSSPLSHDEAHMFLLAHADGALFPLPEKNWYRVILLTSEKTGKHPTPLTLSYFQDAIRNVSGMPIELKRASWMSVFSVHRRITPKMRVGNIFLVGDAAHLHSPFGGQGLNTSVQDAFNLAWKIDLVHRGICTDSFLDSYELERYPVAKAVLRNTTIGTNVIASSFLKRILLPILGLLTKLPSFQRQFAQEMSELDIGYPSSPIIDYSNSWKGPKPGMRAPDVNLPGNKRLFDLLCHPQHTLLLLGGSTLEPLAKQITQSFGHILVPVHLNETTPIYGAAPCYYLIRPDGIIAYRSRSLDPTPFLAYLSKLFKRQP